MGLGHVVLPAPKVEETRAFYKNHLGFGDTDDDQKKKKPDSITYDSEAPVQVVGHGKLSASELARLTE